VACKGQHVAYIKGLSWRGIAVAAPATLLVVATGAGSFWAVQYDTISILPVDYLYWSPPPEALASGAGRGGEMWITGKASEMATSKLAATGWTVVPKASAKLGQ